MRVLGLDIGTTSIGFALIELDKAKNNGSIVRLGVRIFPEARDPDGTPLNQTRRAKRMARRQLRRRRERRRSLNELLSEQGLLPRFGTVGWTETMALEPYSLRAKGLSNVLTPFEFGRAIYHLSKHRHFQERDLAEIEEADASATEAKGKKAGVASADEEDDAKATVARAHLVAELKSTGKTLGQLLAERPTDARRRGEHATRAIVLDEFNRLVEVQKAHHPSLRDRALLGAMEEAIFYQRPVFWRKSTLGRCSLMPGEPLCQKGAWVSQERRMLEKVNNLAISGGNGRKLDTEERDAVLAALRTQKTLSWPGVRRVLEPIFKARGESAKSLRFNLEVGDEKGG